MKEKNLIINILKKIYSNKPREFVFQVEQSFMYQTRFQFPTNVKIFAYSQNEANAIVKQAIKDFNQSYGSCFKLVNFKNKSDKELRTSQTFDLEYQKLLHLAKQENYQELENQFEFWFLNDYNSEDRRHIC